MPVILNCEFRARDEEMAKFQQKEMLERLKLLIDDEKVKIASGSPVETGDEVDVWKLSWTISASYRDSDHIAKQVRDAVGSPWDTGPDGKSRYRSIRTGGYSEAFSLCRWAEVRIEHSLWQKLFG